MAPDALTSSWFSPEDDNLKWTSTLETSIGSDRSATMKKHRDTQKIAVSEVLQREPYLSSNDSKLGGKRVRGRVKTGSV